MIEIKNLSYVYDLNSMKKSINEINLQINSGSYVCFIGKTGCGKTTLAQIIGLILKPFSGEIVFDGINAWESKNSECEIRKKIGFIFQFAHHQLFCDTVENDIAFGPKQLGLSEFEIKSRVLEAASMVEINSNLFKKNPFELSGGQQKRVAIAGVLAMKPKILILDEPTSGIDPLGRAKILKIIQNYHLRNNCTTIHVTHNMQDVVDLADQVVLMKNGRIIKFDFVDKVFNNVESLQKLGFCVPQMVEVFFKLRKKGFKVDDNIYSVEDAVNFINRTVFGEVKKN